MSHGKEPQLGLHARVTATRVRPASNRAPDSSKEQAYFHRAKQEKISNDGGATWVSLEDGVRDVGINVGTYPAPNELKGSDGWAVLEANGLFVRIPFGSLSDRASTLWSTLLAPFVHPEEHDRGSLRGRSELDAAERKLLQDALDAPKGYFGQPWARFRQEPAYRRFFNHVLDYFLEDSDFDTVEMSQAQFPFGCVLGTRKCLPDVAVYGKTTTHALGDPAFRPSCLVGEYKGDVDPATAEPQLAMYLAGEAIVLLSVGISYDDICAIGFALGSKRVIFSAMTFRRHPDDASCNSSIPECSLACPLT
ncbi:uncharacterized protein EV422DRAFT_372129 [Fimicolochytrium jonesii]|uniref:uncharacterized protein n=1 Tax=Fimicolochytrium jonesii TaxID=1396493 RepID=UPI0022FE337E|nr:uncharacterized protein EV422DRAFT_372129 [Fimicolochytrium jonesii]KAI8815537.1 hypothetical protein EV422DRAFT_372129 [Fimicolochytrium jonesii]